MKKTILIFLIALISFSASAQIGGSPSGFNNGIRTKFVQPDTLSTLIRNGLTPKLGTLIYHKDTGISRWEQWNGTSWVAVGTEITGAASTIVTNDLPINRAVISNGSGKIAESAVTTTELSFVSGVTSALQTQLDSKLNSSSYTAADVLSKLLTVDGSGSGLDADLFDGLESSSFLRSNVATTKTIGDIIFNNGAAPAFGTLSNSRIFGSADSSTYWDLATGNLNIRDGVTTRFTFDRTTGNLTATGNLTTSGRTFINNNTDISPDATGSGQLKIEGNAYTGYIALDAVGMHIGHNSAARNFTIDVNETPVVTVNSTGDLTLTGRGSGDDPINPQDFVTKGYGETNFATVTSGTFTPTLTDQGGGATYSSTVAARYERIGDLVYFYIYFQAVTTTGTPTGILCVDFDDMPFIMGSPETYSFTVQRAVNLGTSFYYVGATFNSLATVGDAIAFPYKSALNDDFNVNMTSTTLSSGQLIVTGWYRTSAP